MICLMHYFTDGETATQRARAVVRTLVSTPPSQHPFLTTVGHRERQGLGPVLNLTCIWKLVFSLTWLKNGMMKKKSHIEKHMKIIK